MRHRVKGRKLGKPTDQRIALLRSQVNSLLLYEKIQTTETRAKEVQRLAEKLIATAREDTPAARRVVNRWIQRPPLKRHAIQQRKYRETEHPERQIMQKLMTEIGPRYADRSGGCTRIVKAPPRRGDAAPMAFLMLVD